MVGMGTDDALDTTRLPRVVLDESEMADAVDDPEAAGAVWRLEPSDRELDANLIALPAGDGIAEHAGADVDVLIHVIAGSGTLRTAAGEIALTRGQIVHLPRRARRAILAGHEGLRYLSVHRRKETKPLMPAVPQ